MGKVSIGGPTAEEIEAFNDGLMLGRRLGEINVLTLDGKRLGWFPDVDVFEDNKTSLQVTDFGSDGKTLKTIASALVAMKVVRDINDTKIEKYMSGWRLSVPVESIDRDRLESLLMMQKPRSAPVPGPMPS